jgi:3D (Asp-Asp-Asp) domain-containing protein
MPLFTQKTHQKIFETIISVLVIVNLLGGMVVPRVVNAETKETVTILPIPGAVDNISFPVAGKREPARTIMVLATAYSSDVAQTDSTPCIPANGYNLCEHYEKYGSGNTIASNFLRFDTQIRFPEVFGNKTFIVRDRMNARYNGKMRIDIWMPSREEAIEFGAQWIEMEVY